MSDQRNCVLEFGPYRLDLTERCLTRGERAVPLTPKLFDTLLVLVENSGRVVEKERLMQAVWPDTFVEESSLTQNIFLLRKTLGDGDGERTYIETIPRRGYRFTAEVQALRDGELTIRQRSETRIIFEEEAIAGEVGEAAPPSVAATVEAPPAEARRRSPLSRARRGWLWLGLALLVGSGLMMLTRYLRPTTRFQTAFQGFELRRLTDSGRIGHVALSADGQTAAYVVREGALISVHLRRLAGAKAIQILPPEEIDILGLTFSPDGNHLYYTARPVAGGIGSLHRLPVFGGPPEKIVEGVGSPVSFSPDGKHLTFVRGAAAETRVVATNTDGGEERVIARRSSPDFYLAAGPAWSPDGRWIAVAAGRRVWNKAVMGVVLLGVDDGAERRLDQRDWNWVGRVAWLPDASGVVFIAWDERQPQLVDQLWLAPYPGRAAGEARRITTDLSGYGGFGLSASADILIALKADRVSGLWLTSSDGRRQAVQLSAGLGDLAGRPDLLWLAEGGIVYTSSVGGQTDLWIMDGDGGNRRQLTNDASTEQQPVASARHIYFSSDRTGTPHIWRVDRSGSNLTQVTTGEGELAPGLTPDEGWLSYVNAADLSLWKWPLAGGAPVQLNSAQTYLPAVSPDGKWIACFLRSRPDLPVRLSLVPFEGGEAKTLDDSPGQIFPLQWSADGRMISYAVTRAGISNIWGRPVDGGPARQLTDFDRDLIFRFAWSKDGQRLLSERGVVLNDAVLLSGSAQR